MSDLEQRLRDYADAGNEIAGAADDLRQAADRLRQYREENERLREALRKWTEFIPLLRMITVRQVIEAGSETIDAAGINPWCLNEGLADGSEQAIGDWKLEALKETTDVD